MAADAAGTATAWLVLVGALGGVLITGLMAVVTAILNHRWQKESADRALDWEHARQVRQERREMYAAYWTAWNALMQVLEEPHSLEEMREASNVWRQAIDAMFLICGQGVIDAGAEHIRLTDARLIARSRAAVDGRGVSRALNKAMRADILERPAL